MKIFLVVILFIFCLFFRFYDIGNKTQFGWDQVDNAWAAKNMIVNHEIPLRGMQAKQNSGFYIGPAYYYYILPFYRLFDLDPAASGVIAGVTSIFTFFTIFFLANKIFGTNIALITTFLYVFSFEIIVADRYQWPVNFISIISLIIFYSLYKILLGRMKYFMLLAFATGASFHINFVSIFYPLMIIVTLPFLPKTRDTAKYILFSIPLLLIWFLPQLISEIRTDASSTKSMVSYLNTYFHGFHLRRVLQIANVAFIEFGIILGFKQAEILKYLLLPIFSILFIWKHLTREKLILLYLICIWIIVPWFIFSMYSGEITNYYFSQTRPIGLMMLGFIIHESYKRKNLYINLLVSAMLVYFVIFNFSSFINYRVQGIKFYKEKGYQQVKNILGNEFTFGSPETYLYYYYSRKLFGKQ